MKIIGNDWDDILKEEFEKAYYLDLRKFLDYEYANKTIFPQAKDIYNALRYTSYQDTKVIILGQDPYHDINQAHGLAFSVNKGVKIPASLQNIYKELHDDLGCFIPDHGYLLSWARQGVLLLNSVLTVVAHNPNSHKAKGWEQLTDTIIKKINDKKQPVVYILWGANARSKKSFINNPNHLIIESVHPSPLSAYNGFFGSKPFSRTNDFLISKQCKAIDWQIR